MDKVEVLVTGADQRQGLAVIRSLGRRGISVVAAAPTEKAIGFSSRYATQRWVYPSPSEKPASFVASIRDGIERYGVRLVMPVVESTLVALNERREEIETHAPLAAASKEAVDLSLDKQQQVQLARRIGIPTPKTMLPGSVEEAESEIGSWTFPLVIKPSQKPTGREEWRPEFKVSFLRSWEELKERLKIYQRYGLIPVVQELCLGEGIGCGVLMDGKKAICCYQYHRGREWPHTGGVPVRYESMPLWRHVREYSVALLQAMGWHGVAQVEWKRRPGSEEVVLMEVNGRFWASLPGAIHAGMDFPYWLYQLWNGQPRPEKKRYRSGVASRYLRADLSRLERILREETPFTTVPSRSRPAEVTDFLLDFCRWRVKGDIHAWDDPKPGLIEARNLLSEYLRRLAPGRFKGLF